MKKRKAAALGILGVSALLAAANYELVRTVGCNLLAPKLALEEPADWPGGSMERVRYGESEAQYIDLYLPDEPEHPPLLVLVHGGGFISNDAQSRQAKLMYLYFRDRGFACASVNYRLAQEAPFPGACDDVRDAVHFLAARGTEYGYDPERIAIWGESAGAYLAAREALTETEARVSALVGYYGAYDFGSAEEQFRDQGIPAPVRTIANYWMAGNLEGFASCEEYWMRKAYSEWTEAEKQEVSLQYIAEHTAENPALWTYLLAGTADITVPYAQSVNLADALQARYGPKQTRLVLTEDRIHADDRLYTDDQLAAVEAFLREALA